MTPKEIRRRLLSMADSDYKSFHQKLMPTVDKDTVIGIPIPELRAFAKKIHSCGEYEDFLNDLPHRYYEENNLHAFLIEEVRDYSLCVEALDRFLPYIDNWATCDSLRPKVLKKAPEEFRDKIYQWLGSEDTYKIRFAIECLMLHYLGDSFLPEYPERVAAVRSKEYYVNMMIAWYFATALSERYDAILPYIENRVLPEWIHKKTIQKAVESRRISPEKKQYLKSLRCKNEHQT